MGLILSKSNINVATASLLFVYRLVLIVVSKDYSRDSWINLSIPVFFFIFLFFRAQNYSYIFYLVVGILITVFGSNDNFSGSVLFFISMYDNKNKKNVIVNVLFILISFRFKMLLGSSLTSNIFSFVIAFFFVFGHMYIRFWNSPIINNVEAEKKGLTLEQRATIPIIMKGLSHKDSAKILNITRSAYSERVKVLRKRQGVTSDFLLALSLVKDGIISVNVLTDDKIENSSVNKSDNL